MDKIRVAIVDDNDKMVEMMDEYLGSDDEINVIGRAKNGEEAFDLIKKLKKLQMNCAKKDLKMYCLLPREARWL